ncbi:MAG: hypothetical protein KME08_03355 [Aphanothece sp. CMT-3BRIN-NPC111]|jgi:hypothetical protein|nr:hypothetical protein [Aphanothece sp. CMT-3BRIN-NPC111]
MSDRHQAMQNSAKVLDESLSPGYRPEIQNLGEKLLGKPKKGYHYEVHPTQSHRIIPVPNLSRHWLFAVESAVLSLERLVAGEGTPRNGEPFSMYTPDDLSQLVRSLEAEEITAELASRLRLLGAAIEEVLQPTWNEGIKAVELVKKTHQLHDYGALNRRGNEEATRLYPYEQQRRYWFLGGWLATI